MRLALVLIPVLAVALYLLVQSRAIPSVPDTDTVAIQETPKPKPVVKKKVEKPEKTKTPTNISDRFRKYFQKAPPSDEEKGYGFGYGECTKIGKVYVCRKGG